MRLFILGFVSLVTLACERVPEWERELQDVEDWDRLQAIQPWIWTCRAEIKGDGAEEFVGYQLYSFTDYFERQGIKTVKRQDEKVILGTAILWNSEGLLLGFQPQDVQLDGVECRNHEIPWQPVQVKGRDEAFRLALWQLDTEEVDLPKAANRWRSRDDLIPLEDETYLLSAPTPQSLERKPVQLQLFPSAFLNGLDGNVLLFDPPPSPLFLGGLLVDQSSRVLGWVFLSQEETWGAALEVEDLEGIISEISERGEVSRPYIGVRLHFSEKEGFVVREVDVGSPAYRAGLRAQDRVRTWNKKELERFEDWQPLSREMIGKSIEMTYERNDQQVETELSVHSR